MYVYDSGGQLTYKVAPPLCCGGCCYNCYDPKAGACVCCKIPFYIYPHDDLGKDVGNITKQWRGLMTEALTGSNKCLILRRANAPL